MNNSRIAALVGGIVIIAVIVLGWFGVIAPQLQQIANARAQISTVNAENQLLAQALIELQDQSDRLPELTEELEALQVQIPDTARVDSFITEMQSLAAANGVGIVTITVPELSAYPDAVAVAVAAEPVATDPAVAAETTTEPVPTPVPTDLTPPVTPTPTGPTTDLQPSAALRANLYTINLTVSVSGPPAGMIGFFKALQTGNRLFLVTSGSLNAQAADGLGSATIGGYLFIVDSPAARAAREAAALGEKIVPTPAPAPTSTPEPTPTETATPGPTPEPTASP